MRFSEPKLGGPDAYALTNSSQTLPPWLPGDGTEEEAELELSQASDDYFQTANHQYQVRQQVERSQRLYEKQLVQDLEKMRQANELEATKMQMVTNRRGSATRKWALQSKADNQPPPDAVKAFARPATKDELVSIDKFNAVRPVKQAQPAQQQKEPNASPEAPAEPTESVSDGAFLEKLRPARRSRSELDPSPAGKPQDQSRPSPEQRSSLQLEDLATESKEPVSVAPVPQRGQTAVAKVSPTRRYVRDEIQTYGAVSTKENAKQPKQYCVLLHHSTGALDPFRIEFFTAMRPHIISLYKCKSQGPGYFVSSQQCSVFKGEGGFVCEVTPTASECGKWLYLYLQDLHYAQLIKISAQPVQLTAPEPRKSFQSVTWIDTQNMRISEAGITVADGTVQLRARGVSARLECAVVEAIRLEEPFLNSYHLFKDRVAEFSVESLRCNAVLKTNYERVLQFDQQTQMGVFSEEFRMYFPKISTYARGQMVCLFVSGFGVLLAFQDEEEALAFTQQVELESKHKLFDPNFIDPDVLDCYKQKRPIQLQATDVPRVQLRGIVPGQKIQLPGAGFVCAIDKELLVRINFCPQPSYLVSLADAQHSLAFISETDGYTLSQNTVRVPQALAQRTQAERPAPFNVLFLQASRLEWAEAILSFTQHDFLVTLDTHLVFKGECQRAALLSATDVLLGAFGAVLIRAASPEDAFLIWSIAQVKAEAQAAVYLE